MILNLMLEPNVIKREVFDCKLGVLEGVFTDIILNKNSFERIYKNVCILVSNKHINNIKISKKLKTLESNFIKSKKENATVSNPFLGTFDIEAYEDSDGYAKVYALGYCVLNKDPVTFYLDKNKDKDILLECIDKMLLSNYKDYIFYIHNINYDGVFIIHKISEFNKSKGFDYYKLDVLYKDSYIIKIKISSQDNKNKRTFVDSSNLLKGSLNSLCKSFELKDITKGYFPYKFVNKNTLNYIGVTPDYDYWKDLPYNEYEKIQRNLWDLKEECLLYLKKDLLSLLEIMNKFNKYIYQKFDTQMTESLTISRLSLNIYLKHYLNKSNIPIIKDNLYNEIKKAYYGGVTEVYKPYGENLFYYDVNSLYPYASLNPMCGNQYTYIESFNNDGLDLNNLFGFFYCSIEASDNYFGLLPVKNNNGLIMPLGSWEGWYFSEELKFAVEHGYKIKIIKGYNFNKEYEVFDQYVKDIYNIKRNTDNSVERTVSKSLLNNLLGRFGLNINKPVSEIVNNEKLDMLLSTRECNSFKKINENSYLVSYYPKISRNICEMFGNDYIKILQENSLGSEGNKLNQEFKDVSLVISAAVTSYARIYMNKIKLNILKKGGKIYYTDTDSIITDIPLNNNLIGKDLGQFKLEYVIRRGYFISSKTYGLILEDGSTILKAKGLLSKSLDILDFEKLYEGINIPQKV
uniref:DNA polymerase n=1 Tax=Xylaria hypoxylon TaxID=37992 RepID=A0A6G6D9N3_9PEZI|nr:hypothetical protein [Xylaria hypoxylon]QIE13215.1 hypothetical protein [Xylaria hypoxylon]